MSSSSDNKPTYKLGNIKFTVSNCNPEFESQLKLVLPHIAESESSPDVYDVGMGCTQNVDELVNHIIKRHLNCLWVEAGCLVSSSGKKILVAGTSSSGKTTLSFALQQRSNWRVVCERTTIIDSSNQILDVSAPFHLKKQSTNLLNEAGIQTNNLILREWFPPKVNPSPQPVFTPFDVAVYLHIDDDRTLRNKPVSQAELLRKLMRHSNILRKNGAEKFLSYLDGAHCETVTGGALEERIAVLMTLADR